MERNIREGILLHKKIQEMLRTIALERQIPFDLSMIENQEMA
jgi:antitoxin component of RelBE/YafQ-DinJ toxin-antitoxin module